MSTRLVAAGVGVRGDSDGDGRGALLSGVVAAAGGRRGPGGVRHVCPPEPAPSRAARARRGAGGGGSPTLGSLSGQRSVVQYSPRLCPRRRLLPVSRTPPPVTDLWNPTAYNIRQPRPVHFPGCIWISAKSSSAAPDRRPNPKLLPRLFMLSFWCGEYWCRTDDNRIICAHELVDIFTDQRLFLEGKLAKS